jgi:hypothetical protein
LWSGRADYAASRVSHAWKAEAERAAKAAAARRVSHACRAEAERAAKAESLFVFMV